MYRVLRVYDTTDGRVEQEGFFTERELKKQLGVLLTDAVSLHVFPAKTGQMRDVAFDQRKEVTAHDEE